MWWGAQQSQNPEASEQTSQGSVPFDDGYTKTCTIPSDVVSTAQNIQAGDTVTIVSEDGTTASTIADANAAPSQNGQSPTS